MREVAGSSPEDRSTTIVRGAALSRQSLAAEVRLAFSVRRSGPRCPWTVRSSSHEDRSAAGSRLSPENRSAVGVLGSGTGLPSTATSSSPENRSAAVKQPSATDSSLRAGLPLDASLGAGTPAAGLWSLLLWNRQIGLNLEQVPWRSMGCFSVTLVHAQGFCSLGLREVLRSLSCCLDSLTSSSKW